MSAIWHEDIRDDLYMLSDSPELCILIGLTFVCLFFYNIGLFGVCEHGSALQSAVLNLLVAPLVWLIDMSLYWTGQRVGTAERWHEWSWLQLVGFGLIIIGTVVFHQGDGHDDGHGDAHSNPEPETADNEGVPPLLIVSRTAGDEVDAPHSGEAS